MPGTNEETQQDPLTEKAQQFIDELLHRVNEDQRQHADFAAMAIMEAIMFVDNERAQDLITHVSEDRALAGLTIVRLVENTLRVMQITHPDLDELTKTDPENKKRIGDAYSKVWNDMFRCEHQTQPEEGQTSEDVQE